MKKNDVGSQFKVLAIVSEQICYCRWKF